MKGESVLITGGASAIGALIDALVAYNGEIVTTLYYAWARLDQAT